MIIKKILFNWIGSYIINKNCLDLFSGTGNLGFEAVSRFSKNVYFIEKNKLLYNNLFKLKNKLNCKNVYILNIDVFDILNKFKFNLFFDIIFIDPPYKNIKFLIDCLKIYLNFLNKNALIYVETLFNYNLILNYFFDRLVIFKKGNLGKINYFLFKLI